MDEARVRQLISQGESSSVEFKTSVPTPDVIAVQLASMANTSGGTLLLGVKEPNIVVGVNLAKAQAYVSAAISKLQNVEGLEQGNVSVDGKSLYYVTVPKVRRLVTFGAGYFKRVGTQPQPMTAEEIHALSLPRPALEAQVEKLTEFAQTQLDKIDELTRSIVEANSWRRKAPVAIASAILGAAAKWLFGLF